MSSLHSQGSWVPLFCTVCHKIVWVNKPQGPVDEFACKECTYAHNHQEEEDKRLAMEAQRRGAVMYTETPWSLYWAKVCNINQGTYDVYSECHPNVVQNGGHETYGQSRHYCHSWDEVLEYIAERRGIEERLYGDGAKKVKTEDEKKEEKLVKDIEMLARFTANHMKNGDFNAAKNYLAQAEKKDAELKALPHVKAKHERAIAKARMAWAE
jgi:hypothetical protein